LFGPLVTPYYDFRDALGSPLQKLSVWKSRTFAG
jgi:hypothetical protein